MATASMREASRGHCRTGSRGSAQHGMRPWVDNAVCAAAGSVCDYLFSYLKMRRQTLGESAPWSQTLGKSDSWGPDRWGARRVGADLTIPCLF